MTHAAECCPARQRHWLADDVFDPACLSKSFQTVRCMLGQSGCIYEPVSAPVTVSASVTDCSVRYTASLPSLLQCRRITHRSIGAAVPCQWHESGSGRRCRYSCPACAWKHHGTTVVSRAVHMLVAQCRVPRPQVATCME